MTEISTTMAKLSGIQKALLSVMNENVSRARGRGEVLTRANFPPELVQHYFSQAATLLEKLKELLPDLYGDFQKIKTEPETEMAPSGPEQKVVWHFSRRQVEKTSSLTLVKYLNYAQIVNYRATKKGITAKDLYFARSF